MDRVRVRKRSRKFVGDLLVQQKPRAGDAGLALIVEDGEGGAADGSREEGIVENDVGAFAAQLELNALQIARGGLHDFAAHCGRPGEADLIDAPVFGEILAGGLAVARHDVDDPRRGCRRWPSS
jgi:hypothetical protein